MPRWHRTTTCPFASVKQTPCKWGLYWWLLMRALGAGAYVTTPCTDSIHVRVLHTLLRFCCGHMLMMFCRYGGGRVGLSDTMTGAFWVADALFAFANAGARAFHLHWGKGGDPSGDSQPNTGVQTNFEHVSVSSSNATYLCRTTLLHCTWLPLAYLGLFGVLRVLHVPTTDCCLSLSICLHDAA